MNFKKTFLALTIFTGTQIVGAERPPQPPVQQPASYMAKLPPDLYNMVRDYALKGLEYPDQSTLANTIRAKQDTLSAQSLINIFESLPYTANAVDVAQRLHGLKIMQDPQILAWIDAAKGRLAAGEELFEQVSNNSSQNFTDSLKNKNINLNWQNEADGFSPLMNAVYNNHKPMIEALINAGANLELKDLIGETALFKASLFDHPENVKLLLDAGANPDIQNKDNDTAYDIAIRYRRLRNADLLKKAMAKRKQEKK